MPACFSGTSGLLPTDDPKSLGSVHNRTMPGCVAFSSHLFKHIAKQNHLPEIFIVGKKDLQSARCDTLTTAAARATSSLPCKSVTQASITCSYTISCIIIICRFLSYRL